MAAENFTWTVEKMRTMMELVTLNGETKWRFIELVRNSRGVEAPRNKNNSQWIQYLVKVLKTNEPVLFKTLTSTILKNKLGHLKRRVKEVLAEKGQSGGTGDHAHIDGDRALFTKAMGYFNSETLDRMKHSEEALEGKATKLLASEIQEAALRAPPRASLVLEPGMAERPIIGDDTAGGAAAARANLLVELAADADKRAHAAVTTASGLSLEAALAQASGKAEASAAPPPPGSPEAIRQRRLSETVEKLKSHNTRATRAPNPGKLYAIAEEYLDQLKKEKEKGVKVMGVMSSALQASAEANMTTANSMSAMVEDLRRGQMYMAGALREVVGELREIRSRLPKLDGSSSHTTLSAKRRLSDAGLAEVSDPKIARIVDLSGAITSSAKLDAPASASMFLLPPTTPSEASVDTPARKDTPGSTFFTPTRPASSVVSSIIETPDTVGTSEECPSAPSAVIREETPPSSDPREGPLSPRSSPESTGAVGEDDNVVWSSPTATTVTGTSRTRGRTSSGRCVKKPVFPDCVSSWKERLYPRISKVHGFVHNKKTGTYDVDADWVPEGGGDPERGPSDFAAAAEQKEYRATLLAAVRKLPRSQSDLYRTLISLGQYNK